MNTAHKTQEALHADEAGLRYVSDTQPGIRRQRRGRGFVYLSATGGRITDEATLDRIRALVIPPAWTEVWICHQKDGHLQATGRDARNRKQYRYHDRWRKVRDEVKFSRLHAFGAALPDLRTTTDDDLGRPGLVREKVIATCIRLLDEHVVRVGNTSYARENDSYGLTTLRCKHALISTGSVRFVFRGKSGKKASFEVTDRKLVKVISKCRTLPGHELFQYLDRDGTSHVIGSGDVNDYLKQITGEAFTAKDFRTWAGTVAAYEYLANEPAPESPTQASRTIAAAVKSVAERLGNTPAVARSSYIHPLVLDTFATAGLPACGRARKGLSEGESALLRLLETQAEEAAA